MARKGENIYKRRDGRWEGRYKIGYDTSGKAKYRSIYGRSYQSVKERLIKLKSAPETCKAAGRLTVKMLFEDWLSFVKIQTKPSTYANYRMKVCKHILPEFGGMRYDNLTANILQNFIEKKISVGLSAKYVSDIVAVIKSMAKYTAKIHGFRNPIADVILPKSEKKELNLLSSFQQKRLCHYLQNNLNNTSACILLSLYTGLRIGEICGLKWSDIDLDKRILNVRRTVQRISSENKERATEILIGTPKSRTSQRTVPILPELADLLKQIKGSPGDYVLSGNSTITEPRTMQNRFKSILKKANLPSVNFHSLRHIFATNCISVGFDVKTLSELLGHSSAETTLNRYVHSSIERKTQCINLLRLSA